jgi:hypothetical protein
LVEKKFNLSRTHLGGEVKMNIRKRHKIIGWLLCLFSLTSIPIIFFTLTVELYWAFAFYTLAIIIALIIAIVEPMKLWREEIPSLYRKEAKLIRFLFFGSIILVLSSCYFLIFIYIFVPNEKVVLLIANILLYLMILGVFMFAVGTYMYVKNDWEKKPNDD